MPDNPLPPPWGPAPIDERDLDALLSGETTDIPVALRPIADTLAAFDERDLDALLSGETTDISVALRPVADTLAALQVAPMPAELRGQAIIMAEFRALAEFRAAGLAQDRRAGDAAQTLVLSGPQERLGGRSAPRHRGRRRPTPVTNWRTGTLISAVAVAAVVLAVVLTGNVPGPFQHLVNPSAITWGNSSSPRVQGSATPVPTPPPTPTASLTPQQAQAISLCQAFAYDIKNPASSAAWKQEFSSLWDQLINVADSSRYPRVRSFCTSYVGDLFPDGIPPSLRHLLGSGDQGARSSQVGQDDQPGAMAHP